jgi:tRNA/tmRNA/rRNA uracil-C5-methylase (TrmA/RlmC/RlmD family)
VKRNGLPWAVETADDGWFQVVIPSDVKGWRTQAKLAVAPVSSAWASDGVKLGLYQRQSHNVLPIPYCQVHHPSINQAVQILQDCTASAGTAAFLESTREGGLRYVQLQVERSTGKICLTLVWHAEQLKQAQPALSRLVKALQKHKDAANLWHSIWCHCNDGIGNAIFHRQARRWHRLVGPEYLREPLPCLTTSGISANSDAADGKNSSGWLYFTPQTFRQGNLDGFSVLAVDVAKIIPPGAKVCELYGGVGVLGLTALAHHAVQTSTPPLTWLRCSDENPANPRCFQRAVESLPGHVTGNEDSVLPDTEGMTLSELAKLMEQGSDPFPKSNQPSGPKTSYMVASAAKALRTGQALGANVLIVDPPRKGLEDAVLDELCKPFNPNQPYVESASLLSMEDSQVNWTNDIRTLVYVSCGFDALARDTERLLTSRSGWELESATGYVLFPGSDHVETVCVFQR